MSKKNMYLGGMLVLLLLLAFLYSGPFQEWKESVGKPKNFFKDLNFEALDKIEMENRGEPINLVKADNKWKIENTKDFVVTGQVMNRIVEAINEAKESDLSLVSESADKKSEFEVTKENGTLLRFVSNGVSQLEVIVGKNGTSPGSSYVSLADSDDTYLINASLNSAFDHGDWYDKNIISVEKEKVSKIRFQYPSREFTIEKQNEDTDDSVWVGTLPYKFSVDNDKMDEILDTIVNLEATDIPQQSFAGTGLEKNLIIVQITGDGVDQTLMVGESNSDDLYFAKRGDSDNIYLITEEERDVLEKRISDLR